MTRREFNKIFKGLLKDSRDGYFGYEEIMDESWVVFLEKVFYPALSD